MKLKPDNFPATMEKILQVENKAISFVFNEEANCWMTKTLIDHKEIGIEIDLNFHKEPEVDWEHFKNFYRFINENGRLKKLVADSEILATALGKAFFRECQQETGDFKMHFNNVLLYNGATDGNYIKEGYSYSLAFNFYSIRGTGNYGDDYGLYLVQVENTIIVGAKRYQY